MQPPLTEVKVEATKMPQTGQFGYDNAAYVGSVNTVNNIPRRQPPPTTPITGVYREQYWTCSRWPYTQRVLAITVGLLLGALIGVSITFLLQKLKDDNGDNLFPGSIFTSGNSVR